MFPHYPAHDAFVAPARARPELWRLGFGMVLGFGAMLALAEVFYGFMETLTLSAGMDPDTALYNGGATPLSALALLFSFVAMALSVFLVVRMVHDRAMMSVFGPPGTALPTFVATCVLLLLLNLVIFVLPPWGYDEPLVPGLPLGRWLVLLPLAALAVLIQTSAEEILFRGYLQQQLAARFNHPLVWMVLPSVLFALLHYQPEAAGDNAWLLVIWAAVFGLAMADLTARAGSLGPAMAVHFVNNLLAFLFVSLPDNMSGLALYQLPFGMDAAGELRAWLWVDFGFIVTSWLAARLAIRR